MLSTNAIRSCVAMWIAEAEALPSGDPERARLIELAATADWIAYTTDCQDDFLGRRKKRRK
jgi:hypothetical protein